jgi:hypothetical protein
VTVSSFGVSTISIAGIHPIDIAVGGRALQRGPDDNLGAQAALSVGGGAVSCQESSGKVSALSRQTATTSRLTMNCAVMQTSASR